MIFAEISKNDIVRVRGVVEEKKFESITSDDVFKYGRIEFYPEASPEYGLILSAVGENMIRKHEIDMGRAITDTIEYLYIL